MEVEIPQKPTPKSLSKEYYREYYHAKVKQEYHCPICRSLQQHTDSLSD